MPVPGQKTAQFSYEPRTEVQTSETSSGQDVVVESDKARDGLNASLKKSRLTDLRKSSAEIESQVSIYNKEVIHMAESTRTVDV